LIFVFLAFFCFGGANSWKYRKTQINNKNAAGGFCRRHDLPFDQSAHCGSAGVLEICVSIGDHGEKWHTILVG
jgi:hypothetical protein